MRAPHIRAKPLWRGKILPEAVVFRFSMSTILTLMNATATTSQRVMFVFVCFAWGTTWLDCGGASPAPSCWRIAPFEANAFFRRPDRSDWRLGLAGARTGSRTLRVGIAASALGIAGVSGLALSAGPRRINVDDDVFSAAPRLGRQPSRRLCIYLLGYRCRNRLHGFRRETGLGRSDRHGRGAGRRRLCPPGDCWPDVGIRTVSGCLDRVISGCDALMRLIDLIVAPSELAQAALDG
jgi:hypothetical protein